MTSRRTGDIGSRPCDVPSIGTPLQIPTDVTDVTFLCQESNRLRGSERNRALQLIGAAFRRSGRRTWGGRLVASGKRSVTAGVVDGIGRALTRREPSGALIRQPIGPTVTKIRWCVDRRSRTRSRHLVGRRNQAQFVRPGCNAGGSRDGPPPAARCESVLAGPRRPSQDCTRPGQYRQVDRPPRSRHPHGWTAVQ